MAENNLKFPYVIRQDTKKIILHRPSGEEEEG